MKKLVLTLVALIFLMATGEAQKITAVHAGYYSKNFGFSVERYNKHSHLTGGLSISIPKKGEGLPIGLHGGLYVPIEKRVAVAPCLAATYTFYDKEVEKVEPISVGVKLIGEYIPIKTVRKLGIHADIGWMTPIRFEEFKFLTENSYWRCGAGVTFFIFR